MHAVVDRLLSFREKFDNQVINEALDQVKRVLGEKVKAGTDDFDDDLADFSVLILNAAESYGDFNDEIRARSMLEFIWTEEEDDDEDEVDEDDD